MHRRPNRRREGRGSAQRAEARAPYRAESEHHVALGSADASRRKMAVHQPIFAPAATPRLKVTAAGMDSEIPSVSWVWMVSGE